MQVYQISGLSTEIKAKIIDIRKNYRDYNGRRGVRDFHEYSLLVMAICTLLLVLFLFPSFFKEMGFDIPSAEFMVWGLPIPLFAVLHYLKYEGTMPFATSRSMLGLFSLSCVSFCLFLVVAFVGHPLLTTCWEYIAKGLYAAILVAGIFYPAKNQMKIRRNGIDPFTFINPRMFLSVDHETVTFINLYHDIEDTRVVETTLNGYSWTTTLVLMTTSGGSFYYNFSKHDDFLDFNDSLLQEDAEYFHEVWQEIGDEVLQARRPFDPNFMLDLVVPELGFMLAMEHRNVFASSSYASFEATESPA